LAFYQHFLISEQLISEYLRYSCNQAPDWSTRHLSMCYIRNVVFTSKICSQYQIN